MLYRSLFLIFFFLSQSAFSQLPDSLQLIFSVTYNGPAESLLQQKLRTLDSIQQHTEKQYGIIRAEYDSIDQVYTELSKTFQQKSDSLNDLHLPTEKITFKIDSLNAVKEQKLLVIKAKTEELKQSCIQKFELLDLPKEINVNVKEYTNSLDKLDISVPKTEIKFPNSQLKELQDVSGPAMKNPFSSNAGDFTVPGLKNDVNRITGKVGDIQKEYPRIPAADRIADQVENQAGSMVLEKIGELSETPSMPLDEMAAKEVLISEAKKQAVNHFSGKEEHLKNAMDRMSKYKQKYSSVQSIKDLPKKALNEMRDKPTIERVVPGLSFQYQFRNSYMLDTYIYAGYRLTNKITTGIGWNQRLARDQDNSYWNQKASIYGPRASGNYRLGKGFMAHLEIESMNTFVSYSLTDPAIGQREWVWGSMTGLKKEYRITKQVKGTVLVLYNIFDPRHKSPYNDRLNTRIGFEYRLKKKQSENTKTGVH
jgi:hypothetical protein